MSKFIFKTVSLCLAIFLLTFFVGCRFIAGVKAIHKAAHKGNLEKVKKIIDRDPAQINIQDRLGKTPLYYASSNGYTEIVEYLLAHNADTELGNFVNERPLAKAAKFGYYDIVKALLIYGATVNCKDKYGQTPLHEGARSGNKDVVDILISYGADIFAKDNNNQTPKDIALKRGFKELAQYLQTKKNEKRSGVK